MIRHYFIAALRNMAANRLISAIAILGLSVGIAAALLMALVVRNQTSIDDFLPLSKQTFLVASPPHPELPGLDWDVASNFQTINVLRNLAGVEAVSRLQMNDPDRPKALTHGDITGWDSFYWADPNIFDLLRLPVLRGDLKDALRRPDGIVLTRTMAQKYFGHDDVLDQSILLDGHPMVVRAIIRDLPAGATSLKSGIFASGLARFALLAPPNTNWMSVAVDGHDPDNLTYVRLAPGGDVTVIEKAVAAYYKPVIMNTAHPLAKLLRLDAVRLFDPLNPGIGVRLTVAATAGALLLLIAAINYVNLMLACAARREREIGTRKACGAGRHTLARQFLGEAMLAVLLAAILALALAEWLLPLVNTFLDMGLKLDFMNDPLLDFSFLLFVPSLGAVVGAWPALVLSRLQPVDLLRGRVRMAGRSTSIRNLLVLAQFVILLVLGICGWVAWQQYQFATGEALRVDTDQMLVLHLTRENMHQTPPGDPVICDAALEDALRKLPGVRGAACSGTNFLEDLGQFIDGPRGKLFRINWQTIDLGLLTLYGVKPVAGSLPAPGTLATGTVINLLAVRKLGFASPEAAIGHSWIPAGISARSRERQGKTHPTIVAVVPDFVFGPINQPLQATMYRNSNGISFGGLIHIKLNGRRIPETLAAIDRLWTESGMHGPIDRFFVNQYLERRYRDLSRQAQFFSLFSVIAIALACLGLLGIAIATAERRTKEIGVRKAMGADDGQIVALLLWQFAQPVLWANVIAWPVAWWLMRRWLSGFAYHIDLHWWVFAGASLGALLVALLTVAGQAWAAARQKPVLALRYE